MIDIMESKEISNHFLFINDLAQTLLLIQEYYNYLSSDDDRKLSYQLLLSSLHNVINVETRFINKQIKPIYE